MNAQFDSIETRLNGYEEFKAAELERIRNSPTPTAPASPSKAEHIFYDLIQFLGAEEKELEIRLLYYFHAYQECLSLCRTGSLMLASAKLTFIEKNLPLNMNPVANIGMEAIFFPMKAFYMHKIGQHKEAVDLLEQSIKRFNSLVISQFREADEAALEQELNICRVYLDAGKKKEAIEAVQSLCLHLDCNSRQEHKEKTTDNDSGSYYLNALLRSCLGWPAENMIDMFKEIVRCFLTMDAYNPVQTPGYFKLLELWLKNQKEMFIFILCEEIEILFRSPAWVQMILIGYLITITAESNYPNKMQLCEIAARYSKNFIRIDVEKFHKILSAMIKHQQLLR
jgi:hypothetical protein